MKHESGIRFLGTVCLLVGCLVLAGCPKKSEVVRGPSTPAAPAVTPPSMPGAGAGQSPVAGQRGALEPEVKVTPPPGIAVESGPAPGAGAGQGTAPGQASTSAETSPLKDVFFDYDTAAIRDDQKSAILANATWLQAHPGTKVQIEGHCDERGTDEYNLGLGERRAQTVKAAMTAAGIAADRISTISFGKERPFVLGHDENEWKWNRRAHFEVQNR